MTGRRNNEADFNALIDVMAEMIDAQVMVQRTKDDDWITE